MSDDEQQPPKPATPPKPVSISITSGVQSAKPAPVVSKPGGPISNPGFVLGATVSHPGISAPGMKGVRGAIARGLAFAADGLLKLTRLGFSQAKEHGGNALTQFAQRPEHTRQRVYAFGSYSAIVLVTLLAQLWEPNSMHAEVRSEAVALPEATVIFVRNESTRVWKNVRLTLNGRYGYQAADVKPNDYISLRVDRFAVYDRNGKADFAPKETVPHLVSIDCDRGHYEKDFDQP